MGRFWSDQQNCYRFYEELRSVSIPQNKGIIIISYINNIITNYFRTYFNILFLSATGTKKNDVHFLAADCLFTQASFLSHPMKALPSLNNDLCPPDSRRRRAKRRDGEGKLAGCWLRESNETL